jgi:chromosomal replication initiator protein
MTSITDIQTVVAARCGVTVLDLVSARQARRYVRPRQVAMWLAARLTPHSQSSIGRHFGQRDHTTVGHALRRVEQWLRTDPVIARQVLDLLAAVDAGESVHVRRALMGAVA